MILVQIRPRPSGKQVDVPLLVQWQLPNLRIPGLEEDPLDSGQNLWGQPSNVSGNPMENGISTASSQTSEKNFGSVGANVCVDTHLNENGHEVRVEDGSFTKQSQKRQFRSSKSRRRSERFATNLRNEIQRKKAQLQKSRNPCGEETVEEEVADLNIEAVAPPREPSTQTPNLLKSSYQYSNYPNIRTDTSTRYNSS